MPVDRRTFEENFKKMERLAAKNIKKNQDAAKKAAKKAAKRKR